jgi:hypothetical protein
MMRPSLAIRQQLRDSIRSEIDERTRSHQAKIAALRAPHAAVSALDKSVSASPLVMLAHGDSWFDYPLDGNDLSLDSTDIIAQLESMGSTSPLIQNVSHFGDATSEEMSLSKQERLISSLQDPANWLSAGKPDAILFSGGGNDIAGNQFCIYLNFADASTNGLNDSRFRDVLDMVEGAYLDLFAFRDRFAPGVPIFGHCYDFPTPNGSSPACAGPWLQPSLTFAGWNLSQGTAILRKALQDFRQMLVGLAGDPSHQYILIDTQGTLTPGDWANELHPFPAGFQKLAAKFVDVLSIHFPGRI